MSLYLCLWFSAAVAVNPPLGTHQLLEYDVDLEASPLERYTNVYFDFLQRRGERGLKAFQETYQAWHARLRSALPEIFGANETQKQQRWWEALRRGHPVAAAELYGLSQRLGSDVAGDVAALATAVSLYPLLIISPKAPTDAPGAPGRPSACTSSLLSYGGLVYHGRSLDFEPRDPIAETTVVVRHKWRGEAQYTCLQPLVWTTALQWFTCVRPKAFSLSVNARAQGIYMESNSSFEELLRRVGSGAYLLGEIAEEAMAAKSYDEALQILSLAPVVSSNYFILAGVDGQGAVITRFGNSSSADVWSLDSSKVTSDGQPPWLRVQTNVDHWVPFGETYATHRRQHLVNMLTSSSGVPSKDQFLQAYFVSNALEGSENRTQPEDTGAILRPTTIATIILNPSEQPDMRDWYIWNESAKILPPVSEQVI